MLLSSRGNVLYDIFNGSAIDYTGTPTSITVAATVSSTAITEISDGAFEELTTLTSVTIEEGITDIGSGVFYCYEDTNDVSSGSLTSITLPVSLEQ